MILRLTLELPDDISYVRIARLLGRTLLEHLHVVGQDIDDLETLVGELCSNVLRHARAGGERYCVIQEFYADHLTLTIEDKGSGFAFKDVPAEGTARADFGGGERIGGFGMRLIGLLADRVEFRRTDPHGTTVVAEKRLHYESEVAAADAARLNESGGQATIDMA